MPIGNSEPVLSPSKADLEVGVARSRMAPGTKYWLQLRARLQIRCDQTHFVFLQMRLPTMSRLPVRDPAQRELVVVMSLKTGRKTKPLWVTCAADLINVNQPVILIGNPVSGSIVR